MIYGLAEPPGNNTQQREQQRWSLRSLLYTKVIPRSQRAAANVSRDNNNKATARAQPTSTQDSQRPVTDGIAIQA